MAFASHLGPWLLGTVKNTTGTTAGTIRNMGATLVAQQASVAYTDGTATQAFVLPAGASITSVDLFQTTAFTSGGTGTITVYVNGSAITSAITVSTGATGKQALAIGTSNPTLVTNVGTTDAIITYTFGTVTAGAGLLQITYVVRGSDGSANPSQV